MSRNLRSLLLTLGLFAAAFLLASVAPAEQVLGANARVVYLHGAWVWAALLSFVAAALMALVHLLTARPTAGAWSAGAGRAGALLWVTSLFLSLWAMQTNWNGLYLAEPRWRLAVQFAVAAILIQIGMVLIQRPTLASVLNFGYALALILALTTAESVMHPASPIATSNSTLLRLYFVILLIVTCLGAWQLARWLRPTRPRP